ncbi:hypothetical protein FA15DRAFT_697853 [Coprinopsis marcescibilis]|uniref:G domain-containing protein n=1 Tax=Coprinopsis marcescibilis TaxID=230819 RepID=A0A5C3KGS9_COPMA|nr:hypothetical protein FA15DRAFT_697853 [Coprinopsis marcescibilis]
MIKKSCNLSDQQKKQRKARDKIMDDANVGDLVIPVMGPTGVGKSSFINAYLGTAVAQVGHELESCTRHIDWYTTILPSESCYAGRRLILVDTPGFDDTYADDTEILRRIGTWLAASNNLTARRSYLNGMNLAGVLYLHDINQKRIPGSTPPTLKVFEKLVGQNSLSTISFVTTQWETVPFQAGVDRERELRAKFWKDALSDGATISRVHITPEHPKPHIDVVENVLRRHFESKAKAGALVTQQEELRCSLQQLQQQLEDSVDDDDRRKELVRRIEAIKNQVIALCLTMKSKWKAGRVYRKIGGNHIAAPPIPPNLLRRAACAGARSDFGAGAPPTFILGAPFCNIPGTIVKGLSHHPSSFPLFEFGVRSKMG